MAFNNQVVNGTDILLSIGDKTVACSTSHSIELTNSVREIACKGSGDFTSADYGRFSWTASTDALLNLGSDSNLYITYDELMKWMLLKTVFNVKSLYVEDVDAYALLGQAIITSINLTAGDNENASYSVSLQGVGALTTESGLILTAPVLSGTVTAASTTLAITWTDTNSSPNDAGYYVEYSAAKGPWTLATLTAANATGYTITGLTTATSYEIRVRAKGSSTIVDSPNSNVVTKSTT